MTGIIHGVNGYFLTIFGFDNASEVVNRTLDVVIEGPVETNDRRYEQLIKKFPELKRIPNTLAGNCTDIYFDVHWYEEEKVQGDQPVWKSILGDGVSTVMLVSHRDRSNFLAVVTVDSITLNNNRKAET